MGFELPTYTWRGKTYKTLRGLHTAMLRVYSGYPFLSFDADAAYLRNHDRTSHLRFARTLPANVIANNPDT